MMKIVKKTLLITLSLSIFITSIPMVEAKTTIFFEEKIEGQTQGGGSGNSIPLDSYESYGVRKTYSCSYGYNLVPRSQYSVSVYNMQDIDVIKPGFIIENENLPAAGTAIGINIQERKEIQVEVRGINLAIDEKRLEYNYVDVYSCAYKTKIPESIEPEIPSSSGEKFEQEMIQIEENTCQTTQTEFKHSIYSNPTSCPNVGNYCEPASGPTYVRREIESSEWKEYKYKYVVIFEDTYKEDSEKKYYTDYPVEQYFDLTNDTGNQMITLNNKEDLDKLVECLDGSEEKEGAGEWMAKRANYAIYKDASYNIYMTNSNNANSIIDAVTLEQWRANKTAIYYNYDNNTVINCGANNKTCNFIYRDGTRLNNYKYDPGGFEKTNTMQDALKIDYFYKKDKTCINVKNAEVSYINAERTCGIDEYEVSNTITEDGLEHWHYFIPLNAKSSDGIIMKFQARYNSGLTAETCINAMERYYIPRYEETTTHQKYTELIKPDVDGDFFVGDYYCIANCDASNANDRIFNKESSRDYYTIISNASSNDNKYGCYSAPEEIIPIKQAFYNEITESNLLTGETTSRFNGFNFYYKPIDVSKDNQIDIIFPNNPTNWLGKLNIPTLWDDWYEAQTNSNTSNQVSLDLSKSYETETYRAININAGKVRKYNKDNPYTDWSSMNLDGTSGYIDDEGIISRVNPLNTNIYKLGCGPLNSNPYLLDQNGNELTKYNEATGITEYVINPLYIEGCEN